MHENITSMVSRGATESEYRPSRPVVVPKAVPPTRTVANSIGEFSRSVTRPDIFTCDTACSSAKANNINMEYLFISNI